MVKPSSLSGRTKKRSPARSAGKPVRDAGGKSGSKAGGKGKPERIPPLPGQAAGETEKRILVAARKEFISKGLEGARMQAVATQAGVNKALLHYYFRGKERLYQKVLEDTLETVWGRVAEGFRQRPRQDGLEPLLRLVVTAYVRTLAANPDFPLFMFREMANGGAAFREGVPEIMRRFQDIPAAIASALAAEAKAGKIKSAKPIHFFMNMLGMTVATFLLMPLIQKLGPAFGVKPGIGASFLDERIESITDTLLNGIRIKR